MKKESGAIREGGGDLLWSVVGSVYCFYAEILYYYRVGDGQYSKYGNSVVGNFL